MWVALAFFNRDLELACDEVVVKQCSPKRKKAYAHLILDIAQSRIAKRRSFATMLAAGSLEERIVSIMTTDKKASKGRLACAMVGVALLAGVTLVAPQMVAAKGVNETADAVENEQADDGESSDGSDAVDKGAAANGQDASGSQDYSGEPSRLVTRQYHNPYLDSDFTELWTPYYTVSMHDEVAAQGYEWAMDEGSLYDKVKGYAMDVLSLHEKGSADVLAAVFCASVDMRQEIEKIFPGCGVIFADGTDDSLRVYVVDVSGDSGDVLNGKAGSLFSVNTSGLNSRVYGLEGFTGGDPDAYGATSETTDSGLTVSSSAWKIAVPSVLVDDSIFNEVGERLYYSRAG